MLNAREVVRIIGEERQIDMVEIEKVITDLELVKDSIEWDSPFDKINNLTRIDNAIQTIRELQEQNSIFQRTINALMGQIQEMEEQIPKWHLVADGDLPIPYDIASRPILKMPQYLVKRKIGNYAVAYYEHIYEDCWVLNGMKINDVIAWTELPKFEEAKQ